MRWIILLLLLLFVIIAKASASDWFTVNDTVTIPVPYGQAKISIRPVAATADQVANIKMKSSRFDNKATSKPIFEVKYVNESLNMDETLRVRIYTGEGGACRDFGKTIEVPLCKRFFASITFKPDRGIKYLGIKVNGRTYKGTTIRIEEGRVYVDGKYVCNVNLPAKITFTFEGCAQGWYRTVTKKVHVKITGYVVKVSLTRTSENAEVVRIEGKIKEGSHKVEERSITINLRDGEELRITCEMQYNKYWVQITPSVYVNGIYVGKPPLTIKGENGYAVVSSKRFKPPLTLTFKFDIHSWSWWSACWKYLIVVKVEKFGSGSVYYPITDKIAIHRYYSPYDDNSHYFSKVNVKIPPNTVLSVNVYEEISAWDYYPGVGAKSNLLINGKLVTTLFSWYSSGYTLRAKGNRHISASYFEGDDGWYLLLNVGGHEYILKEDGKPLTLTITAPIYPFELDYVKVYVDGSITKYVGLGSGKFVKLKLDRGVHHVPIPTMTGLHHLGTADV